MILSKKNVLCLVLAGQKCRYRSILSYRGVYRHRRRKYSLLNLVSVGSVVGVVSVVSVVGVVSVVSVVGVVPVVYLK